ncbi:lipopolysaccharide biosynthesis protein [Sphingobacterium allocomposti]|nr:lipopolysaccharide biosynthesis protein [Sphingobacterium composti Yoo et al. 2007 non Ten et al. 2007]
MQEKAAMPSTEREESLKAKTAKGFLWGGLSNGLQQIFALAFGIVLGRILMPEDMGIVGILTIFSAIAAALTESGFVSALSIKRDITHKDYNAVFWCSITVGAALYATLFLLSPLISRFFEIPALTTLARVAFLNFLISSFGVSHSAYLNRNLLIRERGIATMLAVVIGGVSGVLAALFGLGYWSLIVQNLTYCLIVNASFAYFSAFRPTFRIDLRPIKPLLQYSSKLLITNVFININNNFLTTILGKFFPTATVGHYNQANKWNLMGQTLILSISNNLIQPLMTEVAQGDDARRIRVFRKVLSLISFITFPMMFGLALISHDFIVLTIGAKWATSAAYLKVVAFGGAFAVVSNAFSNYTLSRGNSTVYMWNIISFGLLQVALFFMLKDVKLLYLLGAYTVLNMIWLNTWYIICKDSLNYSFSFLFKDVYLYAATALISFIGTALWIDSLAEPYIRLFMSLLSMGGIYLALCFFHSRSMFLEIKDFFLKKM